MEKEIFAYYGRAVYLAQCIEKGLLDAVLFDKLKTNITQARYDELLYEKSQLSFGQLKREFGVLGFSELENEMIEAFHNKRDFLVHSFFWERAVEFAEGNLQYKLIAELEEVTDFFMSLNAVVESKLVAFNENNLDELDAIKLQLVSEGRTIPLESFRQPAKNEILTELFPYENVKDSLIPIFKFEDETYWTICEIGLTQYKLDIFPQNKRRFEGLNELLPIQQFNPRPKAKTPWNFELDLKKKGLKLIVTREDIQKPCRWRINNKDFKIV